MGNPLKRGIPTFHNICGEYQLQNISRFTIIAITIIVGKNRQQFTFSSHSRSQSISNLSVVQIFTKCVKTSFHACECENVMDCVCLTQNARVLEGLIHKCFHKFGTWCYLPCPLVVSRYVRQSYEAQRFHTKLSHFLLWEVKVDLYILSYD